MASSSTIPYRFTLLTSFAVHLLAAAVLSTRPAQPHRGADFDVGRMASASSGSGVDAPALAVDSIAVDETSIDWPGAALPRSGGAMVAHTDSGPPGRGGDPSDRLQALNLADTDDRLRLSPDLTNQLDRDQIQRLRVSRSRASLDDRRSTTHPAELALVAIGPGSIHERRPLSPTVPSFGATDPERASRLGAAREAAAPHPDDAANEPAGGSDRIGTWIERTGEGLRDSPVGSDQRIAVPVGDARPSVAQARVAVPASERARASDDVDSEQEVATTIRSLIHASTVGGVPGDKGGGSAGGGAAGAGGESGATSRARTLGDGDAIDYFTDDPRFLTYFRQIHRRVDPLWVDAFPKSALLDLKQGTVILEFTIYGSGQAVVSWPPLRSSGIDEFDRNCAEAIRRAAPFPPIPRELGVDVLRIRAPFVARNPIVK